MQDDSCFRSVISHFNASVVLTCLIGFVSPLFSMRRMSCSNLHCGRGVQPATKMVLIKATILKPRLRLRSAVMYLFLCPNVVIQGGHALVWADGLGFCS
jgi:hypothetical protein